MSSTTEGHVPSATTLDQDIITENGINLTIITPQVLHYTSTFASSNASHPILTTIKSSDIDGQQTHIIKIIEYAVPLGCVALLLLILTVVKIRHRQRGSNIWLLIRRMRNTNLKLFGTTLRRDSEFSFQSGPMDDSIECRGVVKQKNNNQQKSESIGVKPMASLYR
ncbi:unnamed protein product [Didymodactylos carnosus]|uniref:Uncharacterized protein n=1 Tax=Didymodactylos carnosus TaxID=1234261 RepID=A0A815N7R4_9BILA|nr:unnamed protein product [Didymodactylos carnosus]CAF1433368.1 unnamed protein product [Didymodactylos carnosus]CAF3544254.1 unnamed protein product [Didymodactylos carnosus]CAF4311482.1 unnamed protein product [Didymodactylos carnosus]